MKISEIITDKYKLRIPPTVYYDLLTDVQEAEEEEEPKTGYWKVVSDGYGDSAYICECSECKDTVWVYKDADRKWKYCPSCGARMVIQQESEGKK